MKPSDIKSLKDVTRIPFVTKEELRDEQKAHPPFGRYIVAPFDRIRELPIGASMTEKRVDFLINPGSDMILSTPSFAIHIAEKIRERGIDDLIIYKGAKFYPLQVEKVVRSSSEISDEFRVELTADGQTGMDTVTVVVELNENTKESELLKATLKNRLREELAVTPNIRFEPYGKLERTMFKAKRIIDLRAKK
jgi:phenylacetate-coenzyme A ligase PaaK-like adenylate-forming protein